MRHWRIIEVNGEAIPVPAEPKYCPFCGEALLLHRFTANRHVEGWCFMDVNLKCPNCGYFVIFGVPISDEERQRILRSKYAVKVLRHELVELKPVLEKYYGYGKVEERLRSFGYW